MHKKQTLLLPILICAVAASFYIYDYILRVMPQAMALQLMRDFHMHSSGLGVLASLFFWGYAPMQIPVGILFDKYSARKLLTLTFFLSSLATLGFALTESFTFAAATRFIMGVTTSFSFVGALVVGANWFRGQQFAFYTGLVQFLGCAGAIAGITPVVILTRDLGWRPASVWIALLGFVLTALMWIAVRDVPKKEIKRPRKRILTKQPSSYRIAFLNPQTWWVGLYGFAIWGPVTVLGALWGVPFLHTVYNLTELDAGFHISIIWVTIAFGGPIVGWLSNHFKRRRLPMIICATIGAISSFTIIHRADLSPLELDLFLILFGIGASGLVLAFGLVVDLQPPQTVGAVIGFTNMAVITGGLILQPAVGFILKNQWAGKLIKNIPYYSHDAYELALLMMPVTFLVALFAACFIRETHCERLHRYH